MGRKFVDNGIKASELIAILQKRIEESGDLEITVNTQEGAGYGLYGEGDVNIVDVMTKNGVVQMIEIG